MGPSLREIFISNFTLSKRKEKKVRERNEKELKKERESISGESKSQNWLFSSYDRYNISL